MSSLKFFIIDILYDLKYLYDFMLNRIKSACLIPKPSIMLLFQCLFKPFVLVNVTNKPSVVSDTSVYCYGVDSFKTTFVSRVLNKKLQLTIGQANRDRAGGSIHVLLFSPVVSPFIRFRVFK